MMDSQIDLSDSDSVFALLPAEKDHSFKDEFTVTIVFNLIRMFMTCSQELATKLFTNSSSMEICFANDQSSFVSPHSEVPILTRPSDMTNV